MLDRLEPQSPDALLALIKLYAADSRADKIDLGVGVYRTNEGDTPVFGAIKAAAAAAMVFGSAIGPGISGILIDVGVGIEVQMLGFAACFAGSAVLMAIAARMFERSTAPT